RGGMAAGGVVDGAQNGVLVRVLRHARQPVADANAGYVGIRGSEGAANLFGGIRLEVPHVELGGTAGEEEHDDMLGPGAARRGGDLFELEQARQSETAEADGAEVEDVAAGEAVAVTDAGVGSDGKHQWHPLVQMGTEDIVHQVAPEGKRITHTRDRQAEASRAPCITAITSTRSANTT